MAKAMMGLLVVAAMTATALANVGDMAPAAVLPGEALQSAALVAGRDAFAPNAPGDGTVSQRAVVVSLRSPVVSLRSPGHPRVFPHAAIDSSTPDAEQPDILRLDFDASGNFEGKVVVPLNVIESSAGRSFAVVEPTTIEIVRDGRTVPATVRGQYFRSSSYRRLTLEIGTALAGTCRFGEKVHPVKVVDGNANLKCGDTFTTATPRGPAAGHGDTLIVGRGDSARKFFYGHPALVDGVWYDVTLSEDGTKIAAKPTQAEWAYLKIPNDTWSIQLAGRTHMVAVSGGRDPIRIPADSTYRVIDFAQEAKAGDGPTVRLHLDALREREVRRFPAEPGRTIELAIGAPLTARAVCTVRGRQVRMDFKLYDAGDAEGNYVVAGRGRTNPTVEVFDAQGKSVHTGRFEYG